MQVCISLQTDNHASTPPLSFLQAGCPSCRPTNSVKALMEHGRRHAMLFKEDLTIQLKKHVHIIEKAYLSDNRLANISKSFTHKMATKTSWHGYGTKLRYCHPM